MKGDQETTRTYKTEKKGKRSLRSLSKRPVTNPGKTPKKHKKQKTTGFNPTQPKKKRANETPMTDAEKKIYKIEMRLIKKHFPGLKPRPIKIDDTLSYMAQAARDFAVGLNCTTLQFNWTRRYTGE